ncbi:HAD family hydrolase [Streptomyces sp. JJ66]|uniref:HAD family hydrolase n=1 Tax=Streptomyces sp. JJ66 TaxID=2803843 RepID=UPI001C5A56FA|nr:HAD family hydrolase [Streptomyces sp. JJ66]MBW1604715.1 HAD family hydrolase [Streptomyces sp. JJ66]
MTPGALHRAVAGVTHVLLDFDGPVCDVFAGQPAEDVASELLSLYERKSGAPFPLAAPTIADPLEIVRLAGREADPHAGALADALARAELRAVETAALTPGVLETLGACRATGRAVCIVSNNSAGAVREFLRVHGIEAAVSGVVGRPDDVALMKPDPYPLLRALDAMGTDPVVAVMIGDSISDVQAAHRAGTRSVGFANRPPKSDLLESAGASAVISSMRELAAAMVTAS